MSEPQPGLQQEAGRADAGGGAQASAGRLIARMRADAGVHVAGLAATLKVPVSKLEALEADRYEAFPDTVFLRALASSVCRALKTDPAPVLALLPHGAPASLKAQQDLNASFRASRGDGGGAARPMSRIMVFVVIALLAAALVMAFLPHGDGDSAALESAPAAVAASEAPADPAPEPVPAEPQAVVAQPEASAPAEPPAAAPAPDEALVIRARQQTWVQVRDVRGTVLVQKTLEQGERFAAQGEGGPWFVVIGRADAADVEVRGKPLDVNAIARSNVARFEVK